MLFICAPSHHISLWSHLASLCQLIFNGAVHAVTVGGDLLDLKLLLGKFLSQHQALLVPGALQVQHLGLSYPDLPLLFLGSLLVLETTNYRQAILTFRI